MQAKPRTKIAVLYASGIEVCCPHCGDPQPSPLNGSHIWISEEIAKHEGTRTCVACDETYTLLPQQKVAVS